MKAETILSTTTAAMGHLRNGENGNAMELMNDIIEACKKEIVINNNKSKGGTTEVTRYKTALKVLGNAMQERLQKAKLLEDGKICVCDGYLGYIGNKIDGLPETDDMTYPDIEKCFPKDELENKFTISLSDLKTQLALAKADKKAMDSKFTRGKKLYNITEKGYYSMSNSSGDTTFLDVEMMVNAVILCDGDKATVECCKAWNTAVVLSGKYGKCLVMPVRKKDCYNSNVA